jgi:hypothetical protein
MAESYASLIDFATSWANAKIAITPYDGVVLDDADIAAISHSGTVEVGVQKSGNRTRARTEGEASYEASITFYRSGLKKLRDALVAVAPEYAVRGNQIRISMITFDVDIHHSPPGQAPIQHTRIKGSRMIGYTDDMAEGPDADQVEIPLHVVEVATVLDDGREVVLL